jgi:hypothetical protein
VSREGAAWAMGPPHAAAVQGQGGGCGECVRVTYEHTVRGPPRAMRASGGPRHTRSRRNCPTGSAIAQGPDASKPFY